MLEIVVHVDNLILSVCDVATATAAAMMLH